jgi:hypothetical protein
MIYEQCRQGLKNVDILAVGNLGVAIGTLYFRCVARNLKKFCEKCEPLSTVVD